MSDKRIQIHYRNKIAIGISLLDTSSNAQFDFSSDGFKVGRFDESKPREMTRLTVPRSYLERLDEENSFGFSLLAVLGSDRTSVEKYLAGRDVGASHIDLPANAQA